MRLEIALSPPVDPKTKQALLKPGDYATASLQMSDAPSTLAVPATAVGTDGEESFVVVLKGRSCHRVQITAGDENNGMVTIQSKSDKVSLQGARVIAENPSQFEDGHELDKEVKIRE